MRTLKVQFVCLCILLYCVPALSTSTAFAITHQSYHSGEILPVTTQRMRVKKKKVRRRSKQAHPTLAARPGKCAATGEESTSKSRETFELLLARARSAGVVGIIVRLCVPFHAEGELADEAVRRQRAAIAHAQDELLKQLSTHRISSVRRFEYTPFISMTVDAVTLLQLRSSAEVVSMTEDTSVPPAKE